MRKAFFLDRDGVINKTIVRNGLPYSPLLIQDVQILDNVLQAITILKENDFVPIVITNQPEISRGNLEIQELERIHNFMESELDIHYFYVCPHDDKAFCLCRKPKPGLIIKASIDLNIDISKSYLVGDRWKDISAGQAAGCANSFWIENEYAEKRPTGNYEVVGDLLEATALAI